MTRGRVDSVAEVTGAEVSDAEVVGAEVTRAEVTRGRGGSRAEVSVNPRFGPWPGTFSHDNLKA